jgi:hypothetical protein
LERRVHVHPDRDERAAISKAKGLPLRSETDMEGSHISTRYEYGNVKPPI